MRNIQGISIRSLNQSVGETKDFCGNGEEEQDQKEDEEAEEDEEGVGEEEQIVEEAFLVNP